MERYIVREQITVLRVVDADTPEQAAEAHLRAWPQQWPLPIDSRNEADITVTKASDEPDYLQDEPDLIATEEDRRAAEEFSHEWLKRG